MDGVGDFLSLFAQKKHPMRLRPLKVAEKLDVQARESVNDTFAYKMVSSQSYANMNMHQLGRNCRVISSSYSKGVKKKQNDQYNIQ